MGVFLVNVLVDPMTGHYVVEYLKTKKVVHYTFCTSESALYTNLKRIGAYYPPGVNVPNPYDVVHLAKYIKDLAGRGNKVLIAASNRSLQAVIEEQERASPCGIATLVVQDVAETFLRKEGLSAVQMRNLRNVFDLERVQCLSKTRQDLVLGDMFSLNGTLVVFKEDFPVFFQDKIKDDQLDYCEVFILSTHKTENIESKDFKQSLQKVLHLPVEDYKL